VLVGGVGYTNLRDLSFGPHLVARIRDSAWPAGVDVEDLSAGAIHVLHALQAGPPYAAALLVAGVRRGDPPGTVRRRRWTHPAPPPDEIQARVGEALTGIIGLETLLTVLDHFRALPDNTLIFEVEPRDEDWGAELSPPVEAVVDRVDRLLREAVTEMLA
jgi:hydrogenase maturation protease